MAQPLAYTHFVVTDGAALMRPTGTDANGIFGWIDNFCLQNPVQTIANAAERFVSAHPHQ